MSLRDAAIVAILTGHALKDTDYILKSRKDAATLERLETEAFSSPGG